MNDPSSPAGTPGAAPGRAAEVRHVPAGGISVFANPDASVAPIAELPSGCEVSIVGRRPPWVHIQAGDGLDGWVDGTTLAGIAVGAHPVPETEVVPDAHPFQASVRSRVVEKKRGSLLLALGPALGALGALIAILGAALPWVQVFNTPVSDVNAFNLPARVLGGWSEAYNGGFALGWVITIAAGIGAVVSMISGGGIVRRILGFALIVICAVYLLQTQDVLNTANRGIGTGLNVWDIVDYGVAVTFSGGLLMLFSPSR